MIVSDTKWRPEIAGAGRAKYKALAQAIREGIVSRQLVAGEQLPPVRELAYRIGVTPGTVARAYAVLTDEGRLTAGVGRGTFVTERKAVIQSVWDAPAMLDTLVEAPERVHLLSPKMPEVGQGALIRDALHALATEMGPEHLLNYPSRVTDVAARRAFRASLTDTSIGSFDENDVITSHGGQSAIIMILQTVLHGPSPVIAVDELSYGGFRSAAVMSRAQVVGVPWDDEGPDAAVLETLIKTHGVQVFCTSAEVCNPTVRTTSTPRRKEIAALARRYGIHIIDDDCYRLMRTEHHGPSYRALAPELGWYVTSPSKSLTAALRIGFAVAPQDWAANLARTSTFHSFGVTRLVTDLYAYIMAREELPEVIERIKTRIAMDVRGAVNTLGGHKLTWSEQVPFLWLELPLGWRAGEFKQQAESAGVLIKSAEEFALRDGRSTHAVRIAVNGQASHEHFVAAMQKLRVMLDNPPDEISV
ncbi:PLP-dependent aminotransferase family protein [Yoonia sp.]|uniref:aminotransferase-like domain-containing protein n=1 Tax=Yoonia sp. TaxID=2212373 RepID=UPI00238CA4EF|nr:PLP-dependent aminotransferase family protein [Yoonia sp.]MDE0851725.1 PLP-dependent aminotransferase family protein [Yoonia sp.]